MAMHKKSGRARAVFGLLLAGCAAALAAPQRATRVEIDSVGYPRAKCNDGTQAAYYIRGAGADGSISGRKWLIFLHGGGSCQSDAECAERWYDRTGGPDGIIGFHGNMTTSTAATTDFNGEGILDFDGVDGAELSDTTPFQGFNRVMLPYCSSDTYQGRNTASRPVNYTAYVGTSVTIDGRQVTITNPGNATPPLTSIRFSGRHIVEALADLLMNGGIGNGRTTAPGAEGYVAPPSSATDEVVIAGSSAGGFGVIRNLDNVAGIVHLLGPAVPVFGVIDAADVVGVVTDDSISGDSDLATASFYESTGADASDTSCQSVYPLAGSNKCYSPTFVLKNFIETPHFVAQQAYDGVVHAGLAATLAAQLAQQVSAPTAGELAAQYVRNRISEGVRSLGGAVANPQHVGYFVPNYSAAKHQLAADDVWFYNTPLAYAKYGGNDPQLGGDPNSTMGLPRALACFRYLVTGQGFRCDPRDAKVVSTTYPANPLEASYDAATSTLSLPYVLLGPTSAFAGVSVTLGPLGRVLVDDPAVGVPGTLATYDATANVIRLPAVSASGTTYERVSVTGAAIRVLAYQPAPF